MTTMTLRATAVAAVLAGAGSATALTVPFTETFAAGPEGWRQGDNSPAVWTPTGGPDGSAFIGGPASLADQDDGDTPVFVRGAASNGASGGAFAGNWITGGVTELRFDVRHSFPTPLNIFARIAANPFPGAVAVEFAPVLPNTWTTISVAIDPANPQFVTFEDTSFEAVFDDIDRIQFGVVVPDGFGGNPTPFDLQVDNVAILPTPGAAALLGLAGLAATRRRR